MTWFLVVIYQNEESIRLGVCARLKNRDKFKSELVTKFINLSLKDLIKSVHYMNEKYSIGLEGVTVLISYPKNKSRLVDDEYQMTHTQVYTWESQTHRYTSTTIWTENVVEMKVADEESYARIIFSLPLKESIVKHLNLDALQKHKDVVIMTTDNRANKPEVIVQ
jgi:hypothetical protein